MKVTIVLLNLRLGGQVESMANLAEALGRAGWDVRTCAPGATSLRDSAALRRRFAILPFTMVQALALLPRLRPRSPDEVVLLVLPGPEYAFLARYVLRNCPRLILWVEAPLLRDAAAVWRATPSHPGFYLYRLATKRACFVRAAGPARLRFLVSSRYQAEELKSLGAGRVEVIPNLTDPGSIAPIPRGEARARLGWDDRPRVGYLGHAYHAKGVFDLLRAFAILRRDRPDARLACAWSGEGISGGVRRLSRRLGLEDAVENLGFVNRSTFLSAIDVLHLPYLFPFGTTLFPSTLLEAFAVGVPVVTTSVGAMPEIVQDGETGLLTRPGDPAGAAAALRRAVGEEGLAERLRSGQRRLMREELSPERLLPQYIEVFTRVAHGKA